MNSSNNEKRHGHASWNKPAQSSLEKKPSGLLKVGRSRSLLPSELAGLFHDVCPCLFAVFEELFFLTCVRFAIIALAFVLAHIEELVLQISPFLQDDV
jgi:hypothetical protein